ncbi:hypothetical protein EZJ43_14905 [Pedobacter changchengzhani]|uniref:Copper amine oxidase-like N-terminal domain-containing protein n=1 Tax=Pedobacter changchengzhani TaxID=2529274 RepID=A0A4R5MJ41_9SPHI|nr:hypothetical protein [Pedobacter changchengzhani]TDG35185.1 hypothetical protein EZJ43_14905 [Pedobacter changchengzhani]
MKKLITFMIITICANVVLAQQKYFPFVINGKHGITDTLGAEIIKPTYYTSKVIAAKNQIYLKNFSETPDAIFDAKTNTKQFYESVYNNEVKIDDIPYTMIVNKGKRYLLSEESAKIINLKEDYSDFKNVGKYIIAKFYPKFNTSKSATVYKNGVPMPPKIEPYPAENLAVLTNDQTLKLLLKGEFKNFLPLYKAPEETKLEGPKEVEVVLVNLNDINKNPNFDYILFNKVNTHSLCNSKMVLVKTFVLAKANKEMLLAACKKILKQNISTTPNDNYGFSPTVMAAPPSSGRYREDKKEVVVKKPFKPFFYTEKLTSGNTLFALQETEEISNHIFEAKEGVEIFLDKEEHTIRLKIEGKENSEFSFNPKTGVIYLPKSYLTLLGITVI